jgi:predicted lipoprotein with Yx(FWY)xxD motif
MKQIKFFLATMVVLMLLVSACTPNTDNDDDATATPFATEVMPTETEVMVTDTVAATETTEVATSEATMEGTNSSSGAATLMVQQDSTLGSFLVDGDNMPLYMYAKDTPHTSTCSGDCTANWRPFITNGAPIAGDGVDSTLLGTTTRDDGTVQVTYNGWPLYYYQQDMQAGVPSGQGMEQSWYVVAPDGTQIMSSLP